MVKLKKGLVGWFLFFFWRQKKKQKDRRPIPIKSTLFTKNFITRYRSDNKILLTFKAVFYRRVKGRRVRHKRGICFVLIGNKR